MIEDGSLHWHNVGGVPEIYEPLKAQHRPATVQDVCDSTRLLDALDGCTTVSPLFTPQDVPGPLVSPAMYRHAVSHTTKPLHGPGVHTAAEVRYIARMTAVIGSPDKAVDRVLSGARRRGRQHPCQTNDTPSVSIEDLKTAAEYLTNNEG